MEQSNSERANRFREYSLARSRNDRLTCEQVDEHPQSGKINLGLSTIVRITLKDGTFHEDIGYGHIENCKGKAAAFEKAKKEAATDAMKRALRTFGNVLGNCLYDKEYLAKVTKIKIAPSKWTEDGLHRHADYAPMKRELVVEAADAKTVGPRRQSSVQSAASNLSEFDDEFGGNLFDGTEFTNPDEVHLDDSMADNALDVPAQRGTNNVQASNAQRQTPQRMQSMPQLRPFNVQPPSPLQPMEQPQRPSGVQKPSNTTAALPNGTTNRMLPPQTPGQPPRPQQTHVPSFSNRSDNGDSKSNPSSATTSESSSMNGQQQEPNGNPNRSNGPTHPPHENQPNFQGQDQLHMDAPVGFVTARAAETLNQPADARPPTAHGLAFNPHAESPSIRRTQGVNPGRSAPIKRQQLGAVVNAPQGPSNGANSNAAQVRTDFVNPSADLSRRIGAPMQMGNNRGAYKPPTAVKRSAPGDASARSPLADVSNMQQVGGAPEAKKTRLDNASGT